LDAERVHRLGDDIFAQHRAERGAAVALARERRPARAFELDVAPRAAAVDDLAEQDRAPSPSWGTKLPNWWPA